MQFGSILKKVRLNAELSQEELAEKMFLSRSAVSGLENDKLELKASDMIRWFQWVTWTRNVTWVNPSIAK
ncbi:helix-turn-helix domain-containing protein [Halalkalibacter sp. APA_J-10(15)]|uniref:helix-turn-helix domain-containing protein n=1 Tax=Halalkalibacter sp. APA_J-10(15) TaxID=2933805 RepID=UPI0034D54545